MSTAPIHRLPGPRVRHRWPARVAGLLATLGLLGVGALMAWMVVGSGRGLGNPIVPAAPAASAQPTQTDAPGKPAEPSLTRAQRRQRTAAAALLRDQGYRPVRLAAYDPTHRLRVLIGRGDGGHRAFFFVGGRFIGHDALTDSTRLRLVRSGERTATLDYRLFAEGDQACCPKGGTVRVRFRWDGKELSPDDVIPASTARLAPG